METQEAKALVKAQVKALGSIWLWAVRKEVRELYQLIDTGEQIIGLLQVFTKEGTSVLLCATNKRLFILDRRMTYGRDHKEVSYLQIANVRFTTNLFFGKLVIDDQGEDHIFTWARNKDLRAFANLIGDKVSEYREKSVAADNQYLSTADELKKLWQLKEAGAMTLEEFKVQKKKLLMK